MKVYFTFGLGYNHGNKFVCIEAVNEEVAREQIVAKIGNKFAFSYSETDWYDRHGRSQQERYRLTEIPFAELTTPELL